MPDMAKKTVNVFVDERIAAEFRKSAEAFKGRQGMCLGAAMLMWLESSPETQGKFLTRVFEAEVRDQVADLLAEIRREHAKRALEDKPPSRKTK